jgi:hypothetical protein
MEIARHHYRRLDKRICLQVGNVLDDTPFHPLCHRLAIFVCEGLKSNRFNQRQCVRFQGLPALTGIIRRDAPGYPRP